MILMRKILSIFLGLILVASLSIPALAADNYHFASEHTIIAPELDAGYGLGSEKQRTR